MMKKLILFAGLYCLQPALRAASTIDSTINITNPVAAVNRAKAHFKANFSEVQDGQWFNLSGKDMFCLFHQGEVAIHVFYDNQGFWQYTLKGYLPACLAKNVKDRVAAHFSQYHISYVNEILSEENEPVYVINIENATSVKIIQVAGDDIQVQLSLQKN